MKTILTILVMICFVFAIADPAAAIDRSKKDVPSPKTDPPPATEKTVDKLKKPEKKADKPIEKKIDKSRSKKNYDSFIDKNNNGIDDRAEKKTVPKKIKKQDSPPSL